MTGGTSKLVVEAYGNGNSKFPIRLYVYYKTSQSVEKNQSTVTCGMYVTTPGGTYDIGSWADSRGSYVGTTSNTFNGSIPNFSGTYWIAENKTFTVDHNEDGTGEATIYWKWGVYAYTSFVVGYQNPSGSFKISLPTIARASEPTLSVSTARMKETITIHTNRKSSSFTHTLKYTFAGETATIATGVGDSHPWAIPDLASKINNATQGTMTISCVTYNGSTEVGTKSVSFTVQVPKAVMPDFPNVDVIIGAGNPISTNGGSTNFTYACTYNFEGLEGNCYEGTSTGGIVWWTPYTLASAIPSATEGYGYITLYTYNGTALVDFQIMPFKAIVPDDLYTKPTFTEDNFVLTPTGSIPSTFSGLYIQGKTGIKASFTASSTYSTIASYKLSVDGRVYTGNPCESQMLTKDGNIEVTGTVYDARGYYTSRPKTITVHPYFTPSIEPYSGDSSIICERSDGSGIYSDSGTYLHIRAKRKYAPVIVDGVKKNFCDLKYRYKVEGGSWSTYKPILSGSASADEIEVVHTDVVTQTDTSYLVQLVVTDTMGASIPYDFSIGTDKVTLHLRRGGKGAAFGKYSEGAENLLECAWDFEADGDTTVHGSLFTNHIAKIDNYDQKDFNQLTDHTGYYTGFSVPSSSGCSNYPVNETGILEVISAMGENQTTGNVWGFAYQTYRSHTGAIYTRSYYSDVGWTEWKTIT